MTVLAVLTVFAVLKGILPSFCSPYKIKDKEARMRFRRLPCVAKWLQTDLNYFRIIYGVTDTDFNYLGINYGVTDTDLALLIP